MRDAALDLVLGSGCVGCGAPGRLLCTFCRSLLPSGANWAWPTPCPPGLAPPVAAGGYHGLVKALVNGHKERRQFALAPVLGALLAQSVDLHANTEPGPGVLGWVLVPVPSRPVVVRARGHDPLLRVARAAAASLRRRQLPVRVSPLLRAVGAARDQAGLGAADRARNLAGTMRCRRRARPEHGARTLGFLVVDDVVTTGSTAREAQRALEEAGHRVAGVAAVAATRRLAQGPGGDANSGVPLPLSIRGD